MKVKYIIIDDCYPVIVSACHTHQEAARVDGRKVTSAGFFSMTYNDKTCEFECHPFGESVSLKIKSKPEDAWKLNRLFNDT